MNNKCNDETFFICDRLSKSHIYNAQWQHMNAAHTHVFIDFIESKLCYRDKVFNTLAINIFLMEKCERKRILRLLLNQTRTVESLMARDLTRWVFGVQSIS